jgi:hypothetical protein
MPPKAKRYIVQVKVPILNAWFNITGPITSADANKLIGLIMWETRKKEDE